ncbi:MAG: UDP-N-acetylmuramoyl-L-alanyl-D-glutamate--2,6-diaminopimelate ligase [Bifidobacteriaceae bacterium]|nr:UDP-N-acetylmuramoyl-L-alanyl-D-glutamate--2,6-diaminopimelate ligase [Bifidobacteriaceae bacterium]
MLRPSARPEIALPDAARRLEGARLAWPGAGGAGAGAAPTLTGLTLASGDVLPGDLFVALPGARTHGARHAGAAIAAGAVAVLTDPAGEALLAPGTPRIVAQDVRAKLGDFAAWFYGHPARRLVLVGITGTNGKTSAAHLAQGALRERFGPVALLGTIAARMDGEEIPMARTTLEAPDLQAAFAAMVERGIRACVMEVSSHAMAQHRVDGFRFDAVAFTNLTRDHLDYHHTMEDYFAAKAELFTPAHARRAVINLEDEWGRRLARQAQIPVETLSAAAGADWLILPGAGAPGADGPGAAGPGEGEPGADWAGADAPSADGFDQGAAPNLPATGARRGSSRFTLAGRGRRPIAAEVALPGAYNIANAALALVSAMAVGVDGAVAARGVAAVGAVPGRMETVTPPETGPGSAGAEAPLVVVDYAHAPDAVAKALAALRPHTAGRLIAVLGAGGDRDQGKRGEMGRVAAAGADLVLITDDNPRSEDPAAIRAELLAGAGAKGREVPDRADAIGQAVGEAGQADTVVILGKGHERTIDYGGELRPHTDLAQARQALAAKMEGSQ